VLKYIPHESYKDGFQRVSRITEKHTNQTSPATTDFKSYKTLTDAFRDRKKGETIFVISDSFTGFCFDKPIKGIKI
jgi:hypothetical protein